MSLDAEPIGPPVNDAVSNILKWVLLAVAILTFPLLATNAKTFANLTPDAQAAATTIMQHDPQGADLTKTRVALPQPLAADLISVRNDLAKALDLPAPSTGWTPAYSLDPQLKWRKDAAVGKTVVSSSMIDRVAAKLNRKLYEVPVGFKWFVVGAALAVPERSGQ